MLAGETGDVLMPQLIIARAMANVFARAPDGDERRRKLLETIFNRTEPQGDCFIWKGPHSGNGRGGGYGRFCFQGHTASVHRTVWAIIHGPIPPKKQIDHSCNNRLCCNPNHLVMMTHKSNQKLRNKRKAQR